MSRALYMRTSRSCPWCTAGQHHCNLPTAEAIWPLLGTVSVRLTFISSLSRCEQSFSRRGASTEMAVPRRTSVSMVTPRNSVRVEGHSFLACLMGKPYLAHVHNIMELYIMAYC